MIHPLTFLKGAGLGAGIMYFLDPVAGNRRRAQVRDQIVHACTVCNKQAGVTYRDASNRIQGASAEISKAMQSPEQPLLERVQEGVLEAGRTLGMQGQTWSPTAKAAALVGGAGLIASFISKRDLAALAFGVIGLSFVAKELADQEEVRSGQRGSADSQATNPQQSESRSKPIEGGKQPEKQTGNSDTQSREKNEGTGIESSVPTEKQPIHNL
jgi:hypothetical protein